jgi:hypothetical protein
VFDPDIAELFSGCQEMQQRYIDQRQDSLREVEPILYEAMAMMKPALSIHHPDGIIRTEDATGRTIIYPFRGYWIVQRYISDDPPRVYKYRTIDEIVVGITDSEPNYIDVQIDSQSPRIILWDIRNPQTGLEEMFQRRLNLGPRQPSLSEMFRQFTI